MHALASSASQEHYTPAWIIEKVHAVMGQIDLDPCSTAEANEVVQARRFYTKEQDGLTQRWEGRLFINPPGDPRGELPKQFFDKLEADCAMNLVSEFIWLGFNISQLRTLQSSPGCDMLECCYVCIPRTRLRFTGDHPTKDNMILYYGDRPDVFIEHFSDVGTIWGPA